MTTALIAASKVRSTTAYFDVCHLLILFRSSVIFCVVGIDLSNGRPFGVCDQNDHLALDVSMSFDDCDPNDHFTLTSTTTSL